MREEVERLKDGMAEFFWDKWACDEVSHKTVESDVRGTASIFKALKSITGGELSRSALVSILDKVSAGVLALPFTCRMSEVNWVIKSRCRA